MQFMTSMFANKHWIARKWYISTFDVVLLTLCFYRFLWFLCFYGVFFDGFMNFYGFTVCTVCPYICQCVSPSSWLYGSYLYV